MFRYLGGLLFILLLGCSSTRLIDVTENREIPVYSANRILVIGMTPDTNLRRLFEDKLVQALQKEGATAVRSIDFFETAFTDHTKTETDLDAIENLLIASGFDTVLISRITGYEQKVNVIHAYRNFTGELNNFKDYYFSNQEIYRDEGSDSYRIYHSETTVFCLCKGEEREWLWTGHIDIVDPYGAKGNINDYVRTLIRGLIANRKVILP